MVVSVVLTCLGFAACGKNAPAAGTERGNCYGNGTRNPGLTCLSEVCVSTTSTPTTSAPTKPVEAAHARTVPVSLDRFRGEAMLQLNSIGKNRKAGLQRDRHVRHWRDVDPDDPVLRRPEPALRRASGGVCC